MCRWWGGTRVGWPLRKVVLGHGRGQEGQQVLESLASGKFPKVQLVRVKGTSRLAEIPSPGLLTGSRGHSWCSD